MQKMALKMKTGGSVIDEHCGNCSATFRSASQIFTSITVVDDTNCSKIQEIAILDAILYIYGFSATNLATAFLDYEGDDHLFTFNEVTETSDYIIEHGLPFCSNCVSIFKEVYVAVHQLKKIADGNSVLNKAIKKFAPTCIKIEADSEENKDGNIEGEDCISTKKRAANTVRLRKTPPEISTVAKKPESGADEDLFLAFQFEQEYADPGGSDQEEDIKTDPLAESELTNVYVMVSSSNLSSDTHANINDGYTSSPPIKKRKVYRSRVRSRKNKKLIKTLKSDSGYGKLGRPKKYDTKPVVVVNKSIPERPVSSRIHLARRSTSLLTSADNNDDHIKPEIKPENEETIEYERRPIIKRILTEEQKEKSRKALAKANRKRRKLVGKRKKYSWKNKISHKQSAQLSSDHDQHQESNSKDDGNRKNDRDAQSTSFGLKKQDDRERILKCSCGKAYRSLASLRQHESDTPCSEEPVTCDTCGQSFKKYYLMYAHKGLEHSENPQILLTCNFCDAKYITTGGLKQHVEQHHSTIPNKIICDKCGKSFSCLKYLRKHNEIHDSEGLDKELFRCKECGILLKHSDSLKKHIRLMHRSQKTFLCPECGKTTKNMTNMRIHMKVHDPNRILKTKRPNLTAESTNLTLDKEELESAINNIGSDLPSQQQ